MNHEKCGTNIGLGDHLIQGYIRTVVFKGAHGLEGGDLDLTEIVRAKVDFDAVYGSIFVHEVVHAAFWKQLDHSKREPVSAMATEYVAYALQILSLPEVDRESLLAAFPRKPPTDLAPFNYFALQISPLRFATNAYTHFMSLDDRCQFLREIISGGVEFDDWDQYE